MTGSFFDSILDLNGGDTVTLHRYEGYVPRGGHQSPVFADGEEIAVTIRPWEDDMGQQADPGYSGQTPGFKLYGEESMDLQRGDRIHYRDGEFRLMNPQYDQTFGLERWDMRTDDRQLRLVSELDVDESEIEPPDDDDFGNY